MTDRDPVERPPTDQGSALIITLMVMALVTVLATTVLTTVVNNLASSRRSLDAASALDAADAGVSQAMTYLRRASELELACSPTCATNPWGNSASPMRVGVPGSPDQSYEAWIEPVPVTNPTFYRVHSHGISRTGSRYVQVDATVNATAMKLPLAVFARSIQGGGSASVTRESIFSTGCVYNRSKIEMGTSIDAAYGIRAAVHSSRIITDSNGNNSTCSVDNKSIHKNAVCDPQFAYDQDSLGGPMGGQPGCPDVSAPAYAKYYSARDLDGNATVDVNGSYLRDDNALLKNFGITDQPLTDDQLDQLRVIARSQGNYWTSATGWTSPNPATTPQAVMFFDLSGSNSVPVVDLNDLQGWGRSSGLDSTSTSCAPRSLLIVIVGGNAKMNSNQRLAASLVLTSQAPAGEVIKANGTADFIGTIFADKVNLVGNVDISLDDCFLKNLSPLLRTVEVTDYRELDR